MGFYTEMLINRVARMLVYDDLPETIDAGFINRELIFNGVYGVAKKGADVHAWRGMCGGELSAEYIPTRFIGASPVLGSIDKKLGVDVVAVFASTSDRFAPYSTYKITKDGKHIFDASNNMEIRGTPLYHYIVRTAEILEDIDVTTQTLLKSTRAHCFVSAADEQKRVAAETALKRIYSGQLNTVFQSDILDSLKFNFAPTAASAANTLAELKEQYQFYLAEFYHAIGINANYNLKRERLNTAEVDLNIQPLMVNVADMLKCSIDGWEMINAIFGTKTRVRLGEEWEPTERGANNDNVDKMDDKQPDSADDISRGGE